MNDNQLPLTPFFDRLFVLRDETLERTKSGVIIPDGDKERPNRGTVIAIGPDCKFAFKGQHIIFGQHHGFELQIGTEEITVLREQDIYAGEPKRDKHTPEERKAILDDILNSGDEIEPLPHKKKYEEQRDNPELVRTTGLDGKHRSINGQ